MVMDVMGACGAAVLVGDGDDEGGGSSKLSSQGSKPCRRKHDSHEKTTYARFQ